MSDVAWSTIRRPAMWVMTRRRYLAAATHQMTAIPDVLADNARACLGIDGGKRRDDRREQDERYEFAHGSILKRGQDIRQRWTARRFAHVHI